MKQITNKCTIINCFCKKKAFSQVNKVIIKKINCKIINNKTIIIYENT